MSGAKACRTTSARHLALSTCDLRNHAVVRSMGGMSSIWQPTASTGREPAWVDDFHLRLAREECCEPDIAEWGFYHRIQRISLLGGVPKVFGRCPATRCRVQPALPSRRPATFRGAA